MDNMIFKNMLKFITRERMYKNLILCEI